MSAEVEAPGFTEQDILFECPQCQKSLGINQAGAGLVVTCPDCGAKMRVPLPEEEVLNEEGSEVPVAVVTEGEVDDEVHRLQVSMDELQRRMRYLERTRTEHAQKFKRLGQEMELIQAALDRMASVLQDVNVDASQS